MKNRFKKNEQILKSFSKKTVMITKEEEEENVDNDQENQIIDLQNLNIINRNFVWFLETKESFQEKKNQEANDDEMMIQKI